MAQRDELPAKVNSVELLASPPCPVSPQLPTDPIAIYAFGPTTGLSRLTSSGNFQRASRSSSRVGP